MSWQIGKITLPENPSTITYKAAKNLKPISLLTKLPLVLDLGPNTPVLTLQGYIAETGHTLGDLETDYLLPLRAMAQKGASFPTVFQDDNQTINWNIAEWDGSAVSLSDDSADFMRGYNSCSWIIKPTAGGIAHIGLQKYYTAALNLSALDFVSIWYKGINNNAGMGIYLSSNDDRGVWPDNMTAGFNDTSTSWQRVVKRADEFTKNGNGTFSKVTAAWFIHWSDSAGSAYYGVKNDKFAAGIGYLVQAPDSRYDGIYAINNFEFRETGGYIRSFEYTLELWKIDAFY